MKQESLKQREQRIGDQVMMGMMHDRQAHDVCPDCENEPCTCKADIEKRKKLEEQRGGQ